MKIQQQQINIYTSPEELRKLADMLEKENFTDDDCFFGNIVHICNHPNKKIVKMIYGEFWYCSDCKKDLGDVK